MSLVNGSFCWCVGPEHTSCLIDRMNGPQLVDSRKQGFKVMTLVAGLLHGFFRSLGNIRRGARRSTRQSTTPVVFVFTTTQSLLCITLSQISFLTNASVSSFLVQLSTCRWTSSLQTTPWEKLRSMSKLHHHLSGMVAWRSRTSNLTVNRW